jgi:hypothetical protein
VGSELGAALVVGALLKLGRLLGKELGAKLGTELGATLG